MTIRQKYARVHGNVREVRENMELTDIRELYRSREKFIGREVTGIPKISAF